MTQTADREWKGERADLDLLDNHDHRKADDLYERKQVNSAGLDVTQVDEVRLILDRHRHNVDTFYELQQQQQRHAYTVLQSTVSVTRSLTTASQIN